ncbi:MAG: tetratricopeptide repeat protein [Planctomycetota bacterium]
MFRNGITKLLKALSPEERIIKRTGQLLDEGDLETAADYIASARKSFPHRPRVNLWYARILVAQERFDESIEALEMIARHDGAGFKCAFEAAELLQTAKREDQAVALLERLGSKYKGWKGGRAYNALSQIHKRRGDFGDALHSVIEAVANGGRTWWANVIDLLNNCDGKDIASGHARMQELLEESDRNAFFFKLFSLLDSYIGEKEQMTRRIRVAAEKSFVSRFPDVPVTDEGDVLKPSFLVIGAMKCGTTTLFEMIEQHPLCLTAMDKEIQFFQFSNLPDQWYLEHFPRVSSFPGFFTGDASPGYYAADIVDRVKNLLPEIKLIFIQRDPAKRAISHVRHNNVCGITGASVRAAIHRIDQLEEELCTAPETAEKTLLDICFRKRKHNLYLALGCYELLLRRWKRSFSAEQLLTLDLSDLTAEPQMSMNRVFDFIGVEPARIRDQKSNQGHYIKIDETTREVTERLNAFYENVRIATGD